MTEINCQYRSVIDGQPVCQIVSEITDRPLPECHTNDSACAYCLQCGIAPQSPNKATASMAMGTAQRTEDKVFMRQMSNRVGHVLRSDPAPTSCFMRGTEIRKVACKPCQADSLVPVIVSVYRCPKHTECTLNNIGTHPRIQACSTCQDRLEKPYQIDAKPVHPEVLAAMQQKRG